MSQDTGLWSARRTRETLGSLNLNSAIPQPPSAMKRASLMGGQGNAPYSNGHGRSLSGSRQSLAMSRPSQPVFQRSSSGANLGELGMSSVKRPSFQNHTTTSRSFTPGGFAGRASTDDDRRSSVFHPRAAAPSGTHQSFFQQAPQPAGVPKDPRPLRTPSYQIRIGQELLEYLTQNNFELDMKHTLSQNVIKSPTQKDFTCMFQWLYKRIDPSYRFLKGIDQEALPLIKQLRYPYEKSITKSQITAVGGQNWPMFLGLLHWMMQTAQMMERYAQDRCAEACLEAGIDISPDNIIFDFLVSSYAEWFSASSDAISDEEAEKKMEPHVESMARAFERASSRYTQELEGLEAENSKLLKEVEELEKSTPNPAVLDEHFKIMEEDRVKFEEYNHAASQRSEKHEHRFQVLQEEMEKVMQELAEAEEERRALQQAVDDQGISMQDIDRMSSERERLQKSIETTNQRLEDVKRKVAEKEAEASQKLEDLERMVDEYNDRYNAMAYKVRALPSTLAKDQDFELKILVNSGPSFSSSSQMKGSYSGGSMETERLLVDAGTGYQPGQVVNLDLRGEVKDHFQALRKEISKRRGLAQDTMMHEHDLLDNIKEAMEDKKNEVETLQHRVRAAEEEFEKTREVNSAQKHSSDAQIEKMEKELAKMRSGLSESVQLLEQREMTTNIEYEQLTLRANALREELHNKIERMLNDVVKFKMHVEKSIEDYESFAADEVEKELGSDMEKDDTKVLDM